MVLYNWYFGFCLNNYEKIVYLKVKEKFNYFKFDILIDFFCWYFLLKCFVKN